jgi:hypothetical protein
MTEQEAVKKLLLVAVGELQNHNSEYKWITPKPLVDLLHEVATGKLYPSHALKQIDEEGLKGHFIKK